MQWLFDGLANLLAIFYDLVPNYAVSIILLTLLVMVVLTPLTLKGTRSMMMMQKLQPEMRKLQNRYRDDRQKLNEEMLKFYKENNLNPVGGCLPLLAQAPVFIVLYTVLRGLTRRETDMGYAVGWSEGLLDSGGEVLTSPEMMRQFDPAYLDPSTALYQSLAQQTEMRALGLDLAQSANEVLSQSIISFLPYVLLIALVGVTGFVQQRQIQGRMSKDQVNPQQQMLMKVMPIFLPVVSFFLAGGLVLYFAVSNSYRVGQQWFISRSIYGLKRGETVDSKPDPKSSDDEKELAEVGAETQKKSAPTPRQKDARAATRSGGSSKKGAKGSGSRRTTPSTGKKQTSPSSPVLQPRARKNRKR